MDDTKHLLLGQVLGVGVAGGVSDLDPDTQAEGDGLGRGLEDTFLEGVGSDGAVLEEQVRVVSTVEEGSMKQTSADVLVDRLGSSREERGVVGRGAHGEEAM
jgi:hypothetical protein